MVKCRRHEWMDRIKAVEREFKAVKAAVDDFLNNLTTHRAKLPPDTHLKDARNMSDNLEGTYLIRLYAAFESGLRSYWKWGRKKKSKPVTEVLINSIATERKVPKEIRDDVHEVRRYRNSLVHESEDEITSVGIQAARARLCTFFARLPDEW